MSEREQELRTGTGILRVSALELGFVAVKSEPECRNPALSPALLVDGLKGMSGLPSQNAPYFIVIG